MKPGLILIDIQNDYFEKGNMELVRMDHAAENAKTILAAFRKADLPLFHIQHEAIQPSATFFLPNTTGVEIHESVRPLTGETVVIKHFPNSFRETGLFEHLKEAEVTDVVICGAMSHMCIDATTRAAFDLGFQCLVAEDACATKHLTFNARTVDASDVHASFMAALSGTYAEVAPTQKIIADMA